jgi:two-component system sensor histidine kinase KdpD
MDLRRPIGHLLLSLSGVAVFVWLMRHVPVANPTTVALGLLVIVLLTATLSRLWVAVVASTVAMLAFNFFFLPPIGTFTIADPQNWVALLAFLTVAVIASQLSSAAQARAREAIDRRNEVTHLFDLSRDVLLTTDSAAAISLLARFIARRFDLDYVAICLPSPTTLGGDLRGRRWDVFPAGSIALALDHAQLAAAFAGAEHTVEFDAYARTYSGHRTLLVGGQTVQLVPLRMGAKAIGLLATHGHPVDPATLDALGGVAAIAIERAQFLDERKSAELARQSEQMKSALLTSLGHDLRTPLTAIRVAANNLLASWLTDAQRREQGELVLSETERLTRLFNNILEMARIDAGVVSTEQRWVHPSEIVEAARAQVEHTLRGHPVEVHVEGERLVRLDPRLTAAALAHLLENAAQYTPSGSAIHVSATVTPEGLSLGVRDHGPGISPADLPHLFERFYRGVAAKARASGTGMGLSIARGLLALEQGRLWAENAPGEGAMFSIAVPADTKAAEPAGSPA